MASNPSAYFSTYDKTPYEQHPGNCPCTYHQIDGDKLLQDALTAEWKDWAYNYYNHPDQLTRESTLELFQTRNNWAITHQFWVERDEHQANTTAIKMINAAAANGINRRELVYRVQFLGLPNKQDYDNNWREWLVYVHEIDELLEPRGSWKRCQVMVRVLAAKMKQAGELYEVFWDLEEARQGGMEVDERCEENLKKLRANLKDLKCYKRKLQDQQVATTSLCEKAPPPFWVGGLTAPNQWRRPRDGDPLLHL